MIDVLLSPYVTRYDPPLLDKVLQQPDKINYFAVDICKYSISKIGEIQN